MLSALALARGVEAGELTPRKLVETCAEAIAAREKDIGAFATLDLAGARRAAEGSQLASLPLRGLPVAFKDIFDTADLPTQYGSPVYAGHRPAADASAVVMTRQAGGILIGKTVTTQFASLVPSATRNSRNLAHTPGGSSAGSAAAVAAGMVPIAFGTQTAGSVIRPAAFCGVAAFKPSYRLIPMVGVKDVAWHLDTAGLFGAGVCDIAFAAAAVLQRDLRVDGAIPASPRIALARTHLWQASQAMQRAVETAAKIVQAAGAKVSELALSPIVEDAYEAQFTIQDYENIRALAFEYDRHRDRIDSLLRTQLERASAISADEYDAARRLARRGRQLLADAMADYDVILTPSARGAAPHGFATTGDPMFNRLWTLMGAPCVNVTGLSDDKGLPLGVQIVGRLGRDRAALEAALFVEQAIARKMGS